jgi:uncharacterized protein (DUF885 family)
VESAFRTSSRRAALAAVLGTFLLAAPLASSLAAPAPPAPAGTPAAPPEWVQRSNANAQVLLDVLGRLAPEQAGFLGVPGLDEQITDFNPGFRDRARAAGEKAIAELESRLANETDPRVKQDLGILIGRAKQSQESSDLNQKHMLPYGNLNNMVFLGLRSLLDDQVPAERRKAAIVRLRRYAGAEKGYTPIATLAENDFHEGMKDASRLGPTKAEVEKDLATAATFRKGIGELLAKYKVAGHQKPYAELVKQLEAYDAFVRAEVLPRARTDFRLPEALYANSLVQFGVDMPVNELVSRAQVSFQEIQRQMQNLAPLVAKEKGLAVTDYRDVIRELKKKQFVGDAILPHYQQRIRDLEEIIRREKIVSLPDRPMQIELASAAESADIPAPNMRPGRMLGNTGERGTFVLPLRIPGEKSGDVGFDDFTYEAASWTLTAHEGRPGHELQFSAMVENGVSVARALFALNSVNVEGWGLYAEAEAMPYEPLEGQLVTLQHRLMRAARAHLDPLLQRGAVTKEEATRILEQDVVLSPAMALQEVERYTFRAPGQAVSYFVGYNRLMELRTEAERALGARFDRLKFNDFVLAQGALPPAMIRAAVMEQFVPSLKSAVATE